MWRAGPKSSCSGYSRTRVPRLWHELRDEQRSSLMGEHRKEKCRHPPVPPRHVCGRRNPEMWVAAVRGALVGEASRSSRSKLPPQVGCDGRDFYISPRADRHLDGSPVRARDHSSRLSDAPTRGARARELDIPSDSPDGRRARRAGACRGRPRARHSSVVSTRPAAISLSWMRFEWLHILSNRTCICSFVPPAGRLRVCSMDRIGQV